MFFWLDDGLISKRSYNTMSFIVPMFISIAIMFNTIVDMLHRIRYD